jgi:hypothetical protein
MSKTISLVARVKIAREAFTFFYNRGISEPDRWDRKNSIYFMWALSPDKVSGQPDFAIWNIWERVVCDFNFPIENSSFEDLMVIFDLMEKYAKLWSFS